MHQMLNPNQEVLRIDKILGIIDADLDRIRNEHEEVRSAIGERTKDIQQEKESMFSELQVCVLFSKF